MSLYNVITKRKSTRKFINEPLDNKELIEITDTLKGFEVLFLDSPLNFRIVSHTKGMFNVSAPHYLIISGNGNKNDQVNAGFVGQQFVLWLHTKEIGSVWQGNSKDKRKNRSKNDLIVIAFGKTTKKIEREMSEFVRKDINLITNSIEDECIKAVHLAPSGINLQPWYFQKENGKVIVYKQKLKPLMSLFYKITEIDIGIALCHYKIACKYFNKQFSFKRLKGKSNKKGFKLFGEIVS